MYLENVFHVTLSNCIEQQLSKNKWRILYERFINVASFCNRFLKPTPNADINLYTHKRMKSWANVLIKAWRFRFSIVQYVELESFRCHLSQTCDSHLLMMTCIYNINNRTVFISESKVIGVCSAVHEGKNTVMNT